MPWFRAYIDKSNGDHSRAVDGEAESAGEYEKTLKLKKGEELNQVVMLIDPRQANV